MLSPKGMGQARLAAQGHSRPAQAYQKAWSDHNSVSSPERHSHVQQTSQPESNFLFQDWISWTSASVSQVEKPLLSGIFFRVASQPALQLAECSEFFKTLIPMLVFQSLTHFIGELGQNRTHCPRRKLTNSTKRFSFSWITSALFCHSTTAKNQVKEVICDAT